MNAMVMSFPSQEALAASIGAVVGGAVAAVGWRRFPDGESLVSVDPTVAGADLVIVANLHDPDPTTLALRFAAETARELGARTVGLVAPYLPYMRQDERFRPGEAISARLFANFLQQSFDWLVTVDPHLHRNPTLGSLFRIAATNVGAAPAIADWISRFGGDVLLIGPDAESAQWVGDIATRCGAAYRVLRKRRLGDRAVEIDAPDLGALRHLHPIIVDDIASTGHTIAQAVRTLGSCGLAPPTVIVTHAVFAPGAESLIESAGARQLMSCNTIPHRSNAIDVAMPIAHAVGRQLQAIGKNGEISSGPR